MQAHSDSGKRWHYGQRAVQDAEQRTGLYLFVEDGVDVDVEDAVVTDGGHDVEADADGYLARVTRDVLADEEDTERRKNRSARRNPTEEARR